MTIWAVAAAQAIALGVAGAAWARPMLDAIRARTQTICGIATGVAGMAAAASLTSGRGWRWAAVFKGGGAGRVRRPCRGDAPRQNQPTRVRKLRPSLPMC